MSGPSESVAPVSDHDLFTTRAPHWTADEARDALRRRYGIDADEVDMLASERDQIVLARDSSRGPVVLKISNAAERIETLDMENGAMQHLAELDPALPIPRLVPTVDGAFVTSTKGSDATANFLRVITLLPGEQIEGRPVSIDLSAQIGAMAGRVAVGLSGYFHPAAGRHMDWDIRLQLPPEPSPTDDIGIRLNAAKARIAPGIAATRRMPSWIQHADITPTNILCANESIVGIIDFGDLHHTAAICDVAVSLTAILRNGGPSMWELAAAFLDSYQRVRPIEPAEAAILGNLVLARIVTTIEVSRARVGLHEDNTAYITQYDNSSQRMLTELTDLADDVLTSRFAELTGMRPRQPVAAADLAARRDRVLGGPLAPTFYAEPLAIVSGSGPWLYDASGRRYLDAYNNVAVAGHTHPAINQAVVRQLRELNTNARYLHDEIVRLAERLTASMPDSLDTCIFVTSGTEAVDLGWRMARWFTGETGTIVAEWAYHGISARVADFSPNDWPAGFRPSDVATFRAPHDDGGPLDAAAARLRVRSAADELAQIGLRPAALIVDPQFTSEGILDAPDAFVEGLVDGIHDAGGLLIADEVQSGFGRSGPKLWRFASLGITPDIVTLGKPMGAGLPVAAVVTRREIADAFAARQEYFSTFAGSPVACATTNAVLDVLETRQIPLQAMRTGDYLREQLRSLAKQCPVIYAVRGVGLIAGIDLRESSFGGGRSFTAAIVEALKARGVLAGSTGRRGDVLKVRPPLIWTEQHVDIFVAALADSLTST